MFLEQDYKKYASHSEHLWTIKKTLDLSATERFKRTELVFNHFYVFISLFFIQLVLFSSLTSTSGKP